MTDQDNGRDRPKMQFHVRPDLDCVYRDTFNIFVGAGDVVIEFGNIHRGMPDHVTIGNRIALSIGNAFSLANTLQRALQEAQRQMQEKMKKEQGE